MQTSIDAGRVFIVSNRLPVTVVERNGQADLSSSTGGVATGLGSFYEPTVHAWVGWPGHVERAQQDRISERLQSEHKCMPVFLSDRLVEKFYDGYSNRTIWPLFHSFQSFAKFSTSEWEAYVEANGRFLQVLDQVVRPGDQIWIQDYQLMLLPGLLRARHPELAIGFFLHIPFPAFDFLRLLPQHREVLQSLLSADLIGFHTNDYAKAFLNSVHRCFGLDDRLGQLSVGGRVVQTLVHPMGIDFDKFSKGAIDLEGQNSELDILKSLGDLKSVLSVSRLDYTKGIPEMLAAWEGLMARHPELHGKVRLILAVVPSRERVERYARLKREIDETVGRINAKFGTLDWMPVRYIYRGFTTDELVLLYKHSCIGLVTPLRDGLNLVAKEFVAARNDDTGVLILSELAGASKELLEAIIVNPNSRDEMMEAIHKALTMNKSEQSWRMKALRERLLENPVAEWGDTFLKELSAAALESREAQRSVLTADSSNDIVAHYRLASRRLLVLDYDGTLMPHSNEPSSVVPDDALTDQLKLLRQDSANTIVILSGRSKADLDRFFARSRLVLASEHGAWVKGVVGSSWRGTFGEIDMTWKDEVRSAMRSAVVKIPGSWLEEKDYSLVWHYRRSDSESADLAAKDLIFYLLTMLGDHPVRIVPGSRSIEVRAFPIGKGAFLKREFDLSSFDFVFCAG
ncbi:MAG: bifunctional alpha,alpha-trehalose-phosphate synthase (UDP-forming)/trehalose-phosphatase, partial [Bdellovibrionota bacterium]